MSWVYKPSGGVVGLVRKAEELYGGTVWFQTLAGGVVRRYFDDLHWFTSQPGRKSPAMRVG